MTDETIAPDPDEEDDEPAEDVDEGEEEDEDADEEDDVTLPSASNDEIPADAF